MHEQDKLLYFCKELSSWQHLGQDGQDIAMGLGFSKGKQLKILFPLDFSIYETLLGTGWKLGLCQYSHIRLDFFCLFGELSVLQNSIMDLKDKCITQPRLKFFTRANIFTQTYCPLSSCHLQNSLIDLFFIGPSGVASFRFNTPGGMARQIMLLDQLLSYPQTAVCVSVTLESHFQAFLINHLDQKCSLIFYCIFKLK